MKKILFKGCGTAIATPFTDNGINFSEFKKLVDFLISNNADSLIVCGTTGESATMSFDEKIELIKYTIKITDKKIPIIVGSGSNNTKSAIKMSKEAERLGADGLLVVTPYYNKTTQTGLIKHFSEIAYNVNIPIILYNVPSRTGVNIEPETCLELSKISNIVAIKEASGNLSQVAKIANLCGDNLHIYSGNDDQILPILSLGGLGVISVVSNIVPDKIHKLIYDFFNRNIDLSIKEQLDLIPLINVLFSEVNPIPIKEALNILGYNFGFPRLPLVPLSSKNRKILVEELKKHNIVFSK